MVAELYGGVKTGMPECPVCTTTYIKGKSDHCHVCGWQFDSVSVSTIGPVRIKHQLSRLALMKVEAWAHHVWASLQQQKQRLSELQAEQSPLTARQLPTVTLRSAHGHRLVEQGIHTPDGGTIAPSMIPHTELSAASVYTGVTQSAAPTVHLTEATSTVKPAWTLNQGETAQQERSQLQFQVSQLRAEVQRLQADKSSAIAPQQPSSTAFVLPPDPSVLKDELGAVWQTALTKTQSELTDDLETVWQTTLAQTQSELKQNILQSQTQIQEAIAVLLQTHQVQQQTLLTQQSTIHALQNQLHTQTQVHQEQQQRLLNVEQLLLMIRQEQQEQRHWLEAKFPDNQSLPNAQLLSPTESDTASTSLQQLQDHLADLQNQVQQNQQQFQNGVSDPFEQLRSQRIEAAAQLATVNQQLHDLEEKLTTPEPNPSAIPPQDGVEATRPSHTVYTRYA